MNDYSDDYQGRHYPPALVDRASAYFRGAIRDTESKIHGYDYEPRHSESQEVAA